MYEIQSAEFKPANFHLGSFPAVKDTGTIKSGVTVRKYAPVTLGADGLEEVTEATLDKLIGIAADEPDNSGNLVYYMTGEFNFEGLVLPEGITKETIKNACRPLSIFIK